MILLKKGGVVYMAQSFDLTQPFTTERDFVGYDENLLIWRDDTKPHRLISVIGAGNERKRDILRYGSIFPKRLSKREMVDETYYKIYNSLGEYGLCETDSTGCNVLLAEKSKAYCICDDSAVYEIEHFLANCIDNDIATASYLKNADLPAYELIRAIYRDVERVAKIVQFPVVVLNTKTDEKVIIEREDRA